MAGMVNVHIDPVFDDDERRRRLFGGDVLVYTHVPEIAAFAEYTRETIAASELGAMFGPGELELSFDQALFALGPTGEMGKTGEH